MNRTDRLLAILLELQSKGKLRAEDLAATFEVSKRSIYRDLEALCEAGVPLVAVPGQGYSLMEGYFLPPLSFSVEEATLLLIGAGAVADHFDEQYAAAARSAMQKIEAVLSRRLREEVAYLKESIRFVTPSPVDAPTLVERLKVLRRGIIERRCVRFSYAKVSSPAEEIERREVDPYGIIYVNDTWYLIARCHTRDDIRNFRLSRMSDLELLDETYKRPETFTMGRPPEDPSLGYEVRLLFDGDTARRVREVNYYYITRRRERPDGLEITLRARDSRDVIPWILGWGRGVTVLDPPELAVELAETAKKISHHHGTP